MSGYDPSPALLRALEQGISEFISKPFDAATLRDRIRAMLDRTG
jgi:DNA-binding response OmpR family regulator